MRLDWLTLLLCVVLFVIAVTMPLWAPALFAWLSPPLSP